MPSTLPDGEPAPADGSLPGPALAGLGTRPFGIYVHVPFCTVRCGYCDFNTYTAEELTGRDGTTVSRTTYVDVALAEIRMARDVLGHRAPSIQTVFVGGGTPSLLPAEHLAAVLRELEATFGFEPDVEITTEANPESVTRTYLARLREAGFTRVSLGMQSARPHVLAVLDRQHTPGRAVAAVEDARAAGFEHVNLDLIYGAPGESETDWQSSLDTAVEAGPDHISAYSLIVEEGTAMARRIARGELIETEDDVLADRYEQADETLTRAGYVWYEVSNWSAGPKARCRHNEIYWTNGDWWGIGPGAHSHVGGVRWWNVKHPAAYAQRLAAAHSPAAAREVLSDRSRRAEQVMLRIRMREGVPLALLSTQGREQAAQMVSYGLIDRVEHYAGRAVLTPRGRLLADAVTRSLVD